MPGFTVEQPGLEPFEWSPPRQDAAMGRAEDNDLILVADEVSRRHARLRIRGGQTLLIDQNSLNGTYVNRQRIAERVLTDGDEIWFGSKCRLIFHDAGSESDEATPFSAELDRIREDMEQAGSQLASIGDEEAAAEAVESASPEELARMGRAWRRLASLYQAARDVSRLIASQADLPTRLAAVLDIVIDAAHADRGFIMLRDPDTGAMEVHTAREMGRDLQQGSPSTSIAGEAARLGEPLLVSDVHRESRFMRSDSIVSQRIHSAMGVPLTLEERVLGSIYVDTRAPERAFTESDLELVSGIAGQAALAIENVRLNERMLDEERRRANLGRFLSPAIVEAVMGAEQDLVLGGSKQRVTTMFCDIRGFTPLAEKMAPDELLGLLNEHFTAMVEIVFEHQGTLDKYIGDNLMALFGAPLSQEDDAERAVRTALAMQQRNAQLNLERVERGQPSLDLGIGLCSGEVVAGYMGAPERMEFTVIGDRVNVASRLTAMAGPGDIVAGEPTYERVQELFDARPIGTVMLRGKARPVRAFLIQGPRG